MSKHCGYTSNGSCWAMVANCSVYCEKYPAVTTPLQSTESTHSAPESDENAEASPGYPETGNGPVEGDRDSVHKPGFVYDGSRDAFTPEDHTEARWRRCPQHGPTCRGATCCCLAQHTSPLPPPAPTKTTAEVLGDVIDELQVLRDFHDGLSLNADDPDVSRHAFWKSCGLQRAIDCIWKFVPPTERPT